MKKFLTIILGFLCLVFFLTCDKEQKFDTKIKPLYDKILVNTEINVGNGWLPIDELSNKYKCTLLLEPKNKRYRSTGFLGDFSGSYTEQSYDTVNLYVGTAFYLKMQIISIEDDIVTTKITIINGTELQMKFRIKY